MKAVEIEIRGADKMSETTNAKPKRPARKGKAVDPAKPQLNVARAPGVSEERSLAEVALEPAAHAMATVRLFNAGSFGSKIEVTETYGALRDQMKAVADGDLSHHRALLAGQAIALNSIFTELSRRAALNMGEYLQASETYLRLALKAQAQSRATIEALERLANGHVQTVKHVHVNQGGQAVITDQIHNHAGGHEIGKISDQSQGTGSAGFSPALLGSDPLGNGVPITSGEGAEPVPHARRDQSRRA